MNQTEAINILIQAVEIAQQKGAYSLKDASAIITAIQTLGKEPKEEVKEEPKE